MLRENILNLESHEKLGLSQTRVGAIQTTDQAIRDQPAQEQYAIRYACTLRSAILLLADE